MEATVTGTRVVLPKRTTDKFTVTVVTVILKRRETVTYAPTMRLHALKGKASNVCYIEIISIHKGMAEGH